MQDLLRIYSLDPGFAADIFTRPGGHSAQYTEFSENNMVNKCRIRRLSGLRRIYTQCTVSLGRRSNILFTDSSSEAVPVQY
jgi:hypothetical protein